MNIKIRNIGISKQLNSYIAKIKNKVGTNYYIAPEITNDGINNEKSDIWSLGCIIYELFNLNIYAKDTICREIKKIDSNIYNNKWQELIDLLLEPDYKKRFDIIQIINFLENELNNKDSIENMANKINRMNLSNKNNIIIGEIYIKKEDIIKIFKLLIHLKM